jgi:stage II sporulation protein E
MVRAALQNRLGWLWQPQLYAGILLGFLLGRALGDSKLAPFGIAFYAAVRGAGFAGPDAIPAAVAVLAGSYTVAPERLPWVTLSMLICHVMAPVLRMRRTGPTPLAAGALAALAVAFPAALLFGRTDLVLLIFWIGFTGVVALVFTVGISDVTAGRVRTLAPGESPVPAVILLAAAVCGLQGLNPIVGLSMLDVAAGLVVLACAYAGGPLLGAAAGAVLGITLLFTLFRTRPAVIIPEGTIQIAAYQTAVQSMGYVVAGMLAGTFRELRKLGSALSFAIGFVTYGLVFLPDPDRLTVLTFSAATTVGLFWLIPARWLSGLPAALAGPAPGAKDGAPRKVLDPMAFVERLSGMSRVFKEVSRTFEQVAAVEAPAAPAEAEPVEQAARRVCTGCSMNRHCWEKEFDRTYKVFGDFWARMETEGAMSPQTMPEALSEICIKPEQVLSAFNYLYETHRASATFTRKLEEGRTVVVDYMKNVSRMLDRFVEESAEAGGPPRLESTPVLKVVSAVARLPKRGGHISGDSWAGEPIGPDRYLMALSDGMGVGQVAALESRQCVSLLREILRAGFGSEVAVKTVNSALLLHSPEETFATVDLALLDLTTGRSEFVKVGAAPSFIKRGSDVTLVKVASVPVGIISEVQVEPEFRTLRPGDVVVMITDGIWDISKDDVDKERWIIEFLRRESSDDPDAIAESLLAHALDLAPETGDDLTVLAARIDPVGVVRTTAEKRKAYGDGWVPVRRAPRFSTRAAEQEEK